MFALANLGAMYDQGVGVPKNTTFAYEFLSQAAGQGHASAQYTVGHACLEGQGTAQDAAASVGWFRRASEQGHADAQYMLAVALARGEGVGADPAEAAKWFREAADRDVSDDVNEACKIIEAQYHLGTMFHSGDGVEQNCTEAIKWWKRAADKGHGFAEVSLGDAYSHGRGMLKDQREAAKWYRRAAESGVAAAQFFLGLMHASAIGVDEDHAEAVKWMERACDQGVDRAKEMLPEICRAAPLSTCGMRVTICGLRARPECVSPLPFSTAHAHGPPRPSCPVRGGPTCCRMCNLTANSKRGVRPAAAGTQVKRDNRCGAGRRGQAGPSDRAPRRHRTAAGDVIAAGQPLQDALRSG